MIDSIPRAADGWRTIVADPPWSYADKGSRIAPDSTHRTSGEVHYPTLTLPEMIALPVREVAAARAYLFLWTTNAMVRDAWELALAWGFLPKTNVVWIKRGARGGVQIGMGHHVRNAHELCLVCTRGRVTARDRSVASVIEAPRGRHSAKPERLLEIAEAIGEAPRLELFRRGPARAGWAAWGNEATA